MKTNLSHSFTVKLILIIFLISSVTLFGQKKVSGNIIISPQPVFMGDIPIGSSSDREVIIYNTSAQSVNISSIEVTGSDAAFFQIINNPGSTSISAIGQLILDISFQPNSTNELSAILQVNTDGGMFTDTLEGQGTQVVNGLITFQRIFGTPEDDNGSRYTKTQDGGFAIAGTTTKSDELYTDIYVVRTDKYGKVLWTKTFGGNYDDSGVDIVQTSDGDFVVLASSNSFGNGQSVIYLFKISSQGDMIWNKTISENKDISPANIILTPTGEFVISGNTKDTPDNSTDALLIKTDSTGNIIWKKHYGGSDGESASNVILTPDNRYIFTGSIAYASNGDFDVYVVKTDTAGNELWSKTYGGSGWDEGNAIISTSDSGYLISGYTVSYGAGGEDGYLVKIDGSGNQQWYKFFGDVHNDLFNSVIQTADNNYIAVGSTVNYFSQQSSQTQIYTDVYIVGVDNDGNFQWSNQYGGDKSDGAGLILKNGDGAYSILGNTSSYGQSVDLYFLKIKKDGSLTGIFNKSINSLPTNFSLQQNYPNPFNPTTTISYTVPESDGLPLVTLKVYNIMGQEVATIKNGEEKPGKHIVIFNGDNLSSGVYFYSLQVGEAKITKKMILLK